MCGRKIKKIKGSDRPILGEVIEKVKKREDGLSRGDY